MLLMSDMRFFSPALMLVPHLQARVGKTLLRHQHDALAFLAQRCDAKLALIEKLEAANSAVDFAAAWSEFMIGGVGDYFSATNGLVRDGWRDVVEATGAGEVHDMALTPQIVA